VEPDVVAEPAAKVGRPRRPVRVQEATEDFAKRVVALDAPPFAEPPVWPDERDLVSLRRPLTELVREEREARTQPGLVLLADAAHDLVDQLLAQLRLVAGSLPDRRPQLGDLLGRDGRVDDAGGIGPLGHSLAPSAGREPERQLVRWMEVERSPQRPRLDERAVAPEGVAHLLLGDAVDA